MNRIINCFLCLAFLIPASASAKTFLDASVNPAAATIGDRLEYEITINVDEEESALVKPEMSLGETGLFEVLDVKTSMKDKLTHKLLFTLAVFETGRLQLPVYSIHWVGADGGPHSAFTEPVFVEIVSILKPGRPEPENLDIGPPAEATLDYWAYLVPSALLAALLAVFVAAAWYLKKQSAKGIEVKSAVMDASPLERALMRLAELERKNLPASRGFKEFFTELSDTLRDYLEKEFSIDALEKTTFELERVWPDILSDQRGEVIALLEVCDSVKFAKAVPLRDEAGSALREARDFLTLSAKLNEQKKAASDESVREGVTV
jgi:hypothetical protein